MRKPYTAPNYDNPVEYLRPPFYLHAAPHVGSSPRSPRVLVIVEAEPSKLPIAIVIRPRDN